MTRFSDPRNWKNEGAVVAHPHIISDFSLRRQRHLDADCAEYFPKSASRLVFRHDGRDIVVHWDERGPREKLKVRRRVDEHVVVLRTDLCDELPNDVLKEAVLGRFGVI